MFTRVPTGVPLWPHQRKAVDFAVDHLNSIASACLIRMPTGTGKTGLIACLALLSAPGRTLVLTPWANLRRQMVDALQRDFWASLGIEPPPGRVAELLPNKANSLLAKGEAKVLVSTLSALNDLRRDYPRDYEQLSNHIDLVMVDEGHYEPAVEWGQSVKLLGARTVLLTATPYRNDLKLFRIRDPEQSLHQFRHVDAETSGIIRRVSSQCLDIRQCGQWRTSLRTFGSVPSATDACLPRHRAQSSVAVTRRRSSRPLLDFARRD
jgi:superfamily II DNA or RNA helicase